MNEILSNEEIDTLLDMFRSEGGALDDDGAVGAKSDMPIVAADNRVVSPIDLLKPNRLGREQLRGIERHFESAGKFLSATISDKLRTDIRCDCVAVEQQRFGAWLDAVPGPVAFYVLGMKPFQYPCLLTASTSLLYGAVDRMQMARAARAPDQCHHCNHRQGEQYLSSHPRILSGRRVRCCAAGDRQHAASPDREMRVVPDVLYPISCTACEIFSTGKSSKRAAACWPVSSCP